MKRRGWKKIRGQQVYERDVLGIRLWISRAGSRWNGGAYSGRSVSAATPEACAAKLEDKWCERLIRAGEKLGADSMYLGPMRGSPGGGAA